jgi:flagellar hook protein FlgE
LATIYYTKTSNANQNVPFNKWQTNVFVGEDQVNASLVQATNKNNEKIYVNQYGQTEPYSRVKDELTTAKTQLFSLDELTDIKISTAATISGSIIPEIGENSFNWVDGIARETLLTNAGTAPMSLTVDIDNSGLPVEVDLSTFITSLPVNTKVTGDMLATEATNQLIKGFGVARKATVDGPAVKDSERYGMNVTFDSVNKKFLIASGTTGDASSASITAISEPIATAMKLKIESVTPQLIATRGIASSPAVTYGSTPTVNTNTNFSVDETNNKFIVTVDGIKAEVKLTPREYSLAEFTQALQDGINNMKEIRKDTITPKEINGVKVEFDPIKKAFKFTSGTTGADSFIKISGEPVWGLSDVEADRGETSTWIKPTQHVDYANGTPQPKYIDAQGNETTNTDGFTGLPAWSPVYLDKGELTFDTGGNLVSPIAGTQLETVYLAGGKGALKINIDYSASTQFSSAFAVLSQSQDGAPEGDLVGVTIGNDGLVSASFSNGSQKSLAKILLANFSSPVGLRQIGDSSFLASAASGKPILGTPGSAGFGTLRAGATERANVDLTQELVDLITAQRNFQANAKAIETSSTMTSAIINLRS